MNKLKSIDYISSVLGLGGTLIILGVFGDVPKPLIVFSGIFSSMFCLLLIGPLTMNLIFHYLDAIDQRLYTLHAIANLPPTLYFLAHLTETPWEKFAIFW